MATRFESNNMRARSGHPVGQVIAWFKSPVVSLLLTGCLGRNPCGEFYASNRSNTPRSSAGQPNSETTSRGYRPIKLQHLDHMYRRASGTMAPVVEGEQMLPVLLRAVH